MQKNKRAYSFITVKAINEDKREITGIASTPSTDRMGDIVEPEGAVFKLPIPLLWQHDHDEPIGYVTDAGVTDEGIEIKATLVRVDQPSQLAARLEEAWQSIKTKLVRGLSIGFRPIEYNFINDNGIHYTSWEWYELSAVTIPANGDCTIQTIKSLDQQYLASSGNKNTVQKAVNSISAGDSAKPKSKIVKLSSGDDKTMNIQEQIKSYEEKRAAEAAQLQALMTKSAEEGRTLNEEESEQYEELEASLSSIDKHLGRLKASEKMLIDTAKPIIGNEVNNTTATDARSSKMTVTHIEKKAEQGIALAQMVKCIGRAQGNIYGALHLAESAKGFIDQRVEVVLKAAVAAGSTSNTEWAGALVGDAGSVYADFIEYLRPQTIIGRFGQNGIPSLRTIPFDTPLIGQTNGGEGYWVGEGKAKPLTKFAFNRTKLEPLKVANIAVITKELLQRSSPAADSLIRDQLVEALRERLDIDFINPSKTAIAGSSPASITNGASTVPSTGDPEQDVIALMGLFIQANLSPVNGVWIMSSMTALALSTKKNVMGQLEYPGLTLTGGVFHGLPVIVSEYVGNILVLANASDIYLGDEGGFQVDMSDQASLEMDSAPAHDSITPAPAQLVSLWQTNSVGFRAEREINWQPRRAAAVAYVTDVNYSGLPTT